MAQRYTPEAVAKIVQKMRRGKSDAIQLNAAIELLVWGYGRPAPLAEYGGEDLRIVVTYTDGPITSPRVPLPGGASETWRSASGYLLPAQSTPKEE